ncbi:DUF3006 family protein [Saliphagus sp. LR7]|uniref:DUF3006 family protein n=1 Tax=Saliphagus sp. LR7 TaxID=2282654 RepID=UPI000DF75EB5|nr:DUF3006 family protein [Saliphagus sp. LR7]
MDGSYTGVVDRIVDGETAVILMEAGPGCDASSEDGPRAIDQLDVAADRLPREGRYEGAVLSVTVADGEFVGADHREGESEERREAVDERFDRLSERLPDR